MEKVTLMYLNTGGGHYSAARALAEHIHKTGRGIARLLNPVEKHSVFLKNLIEKGYAQLQGNFRFAWPFLYRVSRSKHIIQSYQKSMEIFLTEILVEIFKKDRPQKIIILHFLLIAPVRQAAKLLGIPAENCITIVLDPFSVHPIWYRENPFPIFCFSDLAVTTILSDGRVDPGRVRQFPIVVSERFSQASSLEKGNCRRLLILGGGEGSRKGFRLLKALLKQRQDFEIHFVCGKSETLYRKASRLMAQEKVQAYRFVDNLEELISKSDIILTKAGPASIMECLLLGKPVILFDYMYGQERGNVNFVEENDLGRYISNPRKLLKALDYYLSSSYQEKFLRKLEQLDLQVGTEKIVSNILENSERPLSY